MKARLEKFLVDRIHREWIDRLYPQGWVEVEPHPTAIDIDIINKGVSTPANQN